MKGRRESSRTRAGPAESGDPDPAGLKHKHFPDELSQQQNDALGARIALKFKSGC